MDISIGWKEISSICHNIFFAANYPNFYSKSFRNPYKQVIFYSKFCRISSMRPMLFLLTLNFLYTIKTAQEPCAKLVMVDLGINFFSSLFAELKKLSIFAQDYRGNE